MYLSLRVNAHPAKEECKPAEREDSGSQELYVQAVFHGRDLISSAKVMQKNETAK